MSQEPWERRYDYVWGLDSDVDLTKTNLTKLFEMVKKSNALIVGPTFVGSGGMRSSVYIYLYDTYITYYIILYIGYFLHSLSLNVNRRQWVASRGRP